MTRSELEQCIERYGGDLLHFCRYLTRDTVEGEELYQETFLKAMELLDRIDLQNNPKSYLLSIALRLWRNRSRRLGRQKQHLGQSIELLKEEGQPLRDETQHTPEEQLLEQELLRFTAQSVQRLPDRFRIPITLYYSAGLPVKEIAGILRLPEGTVKRRLHRARQLIEKELEDAGYAE